MTENLKKYKHYVFFGNDKVFKNGKGHEMKGFLTKEEQKDIKKELKKLQGYAEENNKLVCQQFFRQFSCVDF